MVKRRFLLTSAACGLTLLVVSCGGEEHIDEVENIIQVADSTEEDEFASMFDESPEVDYHLPSPLQVASIFKKSGLAYNSGSTSDPESADTYTEKLNQMLNFGIYSADMAYCVMNDQANEGRKFLTAITSLSEKIGMEAVFENKDLMDRFDANLDVKDSIEILMIDIHERTEEYMEENDMSHQSAIQFAGAWTEGMYLGVYDFEKNNQNKDVGSQIAEQISILNNIIKGLKDSRNDGMELGWLISDMEKIQSTFDSFTTVLAFEADESASELVLEEEEYKVLGELVKDLRGKIIAG